MSGKEYYNFLVLGAEATGKTCLCSSFSRGLFLDQHVPTIDDEYKKTITYGTEVDLTIADLGGWHIDSVDQDCLQRIKWAQGIVLVYDITKPSTLQLLSEIKTKVDQVKDIKSTDEFKLPTIVVGTKADLEHARAVTGSELKKWADEHGVSYYTEVGLSQDVYSAKEVFIRLIGEIRAQEQAKKDARAAPKTPESGEKRKSLISPRSMLSLRKRGQTLSQTDNNAPSKTPEEESGTAAGAGASPAIEPVNNNQESEQKEKEKEKEKELEKEKEKEMKKEQKEKEKEVKKQLKEQKAKEKEEKERQKREQKDRQKAEKLIEKEKKEQEKLEKEKEKEKLQQQQQQQQQAKQVEAAVSNAADEAAPAAEAAPAVVVVPPTDSLEMPAVTVTTSEQETTPGSDTAEAPAQPDTTEASIDPLSPVKQGEGDVEGEKKEKEKKERRKRRETIAALLSPRRNSVSSGTHAKESGSVIAPPDEGSMSDNFEVVHEGLVSPRGEGAQTLREKKKSRLSIKRFRRSEIFPKAMGARSQSEEEGVGSTTTPQVQFLRVTKPLDALADNYKISPVGAESPVMSADPSAPATPVSHPHLAVHVTPSASQLSPRMRSPSFRSAPAKPLPTTPGLGKHPAPSRQPLPSLPIVKTTSASSTTSHTAPMPAIEVVGEPSPATSGAVTFDFPNLEDLPIFQDLFPPPTHLGPPPPPPTAQAAGGTPSASGAGGVMC